MDSPKLQNSEWQAALTQALPHLQQFQTHLNAISEDLKTIEKVLTDSGFRIETHIHIDSGDRLGWGETARNAWRVCLTEEMSDDHERRTPLIETSAAIRWRVAKFVPQLLSEIASVAQSAPARLLTVEAPVDDVPF